MCIRDSSGSVPSTPYTTNEKGQGPAWANSLFEDFCEFGLGMELANEKMRDRIVKLFNQILEGDNAPAEAKEVLKAWIENMYDADKTKELAPQIEAIIEQGIAAGCPVSKELKGLTQYLVKRSQWIIGGDGASYDIGYGGLDHVIASGKDVNILVLDTEVYSNTGGQSSKATPVGAIAKFAAAGKRVRKKDLGLMATTYGYVYVAQIAMGADQAQTLKAIREAEAYPGPSLIIAYAPCINHGLKLGMGKSQACLLYTSLDYLQDYLHHGFYPFFLEKRNFSENLLKTMNMMVEVDILLIKQIELKYLSKIKKLLYMLAVDGPKAPNVSQLANDIQLSLIHISISR